MSLIEPLPVTQASWVETVAIVGRSDDNSRPMMSEPPTAPMSFANDVPPAELRTARGDRIGAVAAWVAIAISVGLVTVAVQRASMAREQSLRQAETGAIVAPAGPQIGLVAKYAIGVREMMRSLGMPPPPNLGSEISEAGKTPSNQLKLVPVLAELNGKEAALAELHRLSPGTVPATRPAATQPATAPAAPPPVVLHPEDEQVANLLRDLYTDGADTLSGDDRRTITSRIGWPGRLALTYGQPDHPDRPALLRDALRFTLVFLSFGAAAFGGIVIGLVLLIVAIVLLSRRSIRMRYQEPAGTVDGPFGVSSAPQTVRNGFALRPGELPPPWAAYGGTIGSITGPPAAQSNTTPYASPSLPTASTFHALGGYRFGPLGGANGRTTPFLEAFAIYLAGQVGVSLLIRHFIADYGIAWNFLVLAPVILALFWPWLRGVRGSDFRRGFGWTAPRGVLRELGSGVIGYIAGLPVFVVSLIIVVILVNLTQASPTHPVVQDAGAGGLWQTVLLYLLAAVWAPVVEETFFRGALFHHLRTRWGWMITAVLSSLIFAVIHPQGWPLVPGLMSLAIVFCAIREWRGSTLGGMMAHALHNGSLVTILVLAAG